MFPFYIVKNFYFSVVVPHKFSHLIEYHFEQSIILCDHCVSKRKNIDRNWNCIFPPLFCINFPTKSNTLFSLGLGTAVVPMYLLEIAPTKLQGSIATFFSLGITIGVLLGQILGLNWLLGKHLCCFFTPKISRRCQNPKQSQDSRACAQNFVRKLNHV